MASRDSCATQTTLFHMVPTGNAKVPLFVQHPVVPTTSVTGTTITGIDGADDDGGDGNI